MHLKKQSLLWTLWTDFDKGRLSPVCVLRGHAGIWYDLGFSGVDHQVCGDTVWVFMTSLQLRLLVSIAPNNHVVLGKCCGIQCLHGLLGSSVARSGPACRKWSRQWW